MKLDLGEILSLLPQRPPFLFVRSAEIVGENEIHARCLWDADNPIMAGHFPGFGIVPAVLLVEAAAQVGGIQIARRLKMEHDEMGAMLGVLSAIRRISVHRPVFPGVEVDYRVTLDEPVGAMFGIRVEAFLAGDEDRVLKGELVLTIVAATNLRGT